MTFARSSFVTLALLLMLAGCGSTIDMMKHQLGYERRDILVDNVKNARDKEDAAKQQFQTTLQQFEAVTNFNGGDLAAEYNKLNSQYDSCVSRADAVHSQISRVEASADKLFTEWQSELSQYDSPDLRRSSEQKLAETKVKYQRVIDSMKTAESRMEPVLKAFHDQVLYLKHNLDAAAIASLQSTASGINDDVAKLIKDMEASIAEADAFVSQLK